MIVVHEFTASVEYNEDAKAWEYGVIEYTEDENGITSEVALQSGETDSYENALTNILTKLGNVRRPTI